MDVETDAVAGAMHEILAEAGSLDDIAHDAIDGFGGDTRTHGGEPGAVRLEDDRVDLAQASGCRAKAPGSRHVGAVAIARSAEVGQHAHTLREHGVARVVMRHRSIRTGSDDAEGAGQVVAGRSEMSAEVVLHFEFGASAELGRLEEPAVRLIVGVGGGSQQLELVCRLAHPQRHEDVVPGAPGDLAVPHELQREPHGRAGTDRDARTRADAEGVEQHGGRIVAVRPADQLDAGIDDRLHGIGFEPGRDGPSCAVGGDAERDETLTQRRLGAGQVGEVGRRRQDHRIRAGLG